MRDVYSTINRGQKIAAGSVATTLESAYATIQTFGNPSDSPDQAKGSLDTFIEQLRPLLDRGPDDNIGVDRLRLPGRPDMPAGATSAVYSWTTVLGGELAVPCTRNPLQRDGIPTQGAGL